MKVMQLHKERGVEGHKRDKEREKALEINPGNL